MAKKDPTVVVKKPLNAAHEQLTAKELQTAFEVSDGALLQQKVNEIAQLLWVHEDASEDAKCERIIRALQLYESLEPADGAEGMLAMQMVGTHDAALECLKRAALPNQTFAGRDMALKHAHKLMTLYTQQLATLNKHRGKGQQRVTVEHVNVEAGGQAIVGNVDASAQGTKPQNPEPGRLDHTEMPQFEDALRKNRQRPGNPEHGIPLQAQHRTHDEFCALWREDPQGHALSGPRRCGQGPLQDARRGERLRCAQRQQECLETRALHCSVQNAQ